MKISILFKIVFYLFFFPIIFIIAGCNCDSQTLRYNTWILTHYGPKSNPIPVLDPLTTTPPGLGDITLRFIGWNDIKGSDGCNIGCNDYFAGFSSSLCGCSVNNLEFRVGSCSQDVNIQASSYLDILEDVKTYGTRNGNLKLYTSDDRILIFGKK
jgi:hypothetical protein